MRQFTEDEIKMAEKAEEIQKIRGKLYTSKKDVGIYKAGKYKLMEQGDIFYTEIGGGHQGQGQYISFGLAYPDAIWLPLEHQLWEMVSGDLQAKFRDLCALFCLDDKGEFANNFESWLDELVSDSYGGSLANLWQLLLAFVMHELYGKVWAGLDKGGWVKE